MATAAREQERRHKHGGYARCSHQAVEELGEAGTGRGGRGRRPAGVGGRQSGATRWEGLRPGSVRAGGTLPAWSGDEVDSVRGASLVAGTGGARRGGQRGAAPIQSREVRGGARRGPGGAAALAERRRGGAVAPRSGSGGSKRSEV